MMDKARLQPDRKEARAVPTGVRTFFLAAGRPETAVAAPDLLGPTGFEFKIGSGT
jgi:hypothetical protein